jgi:hypothetical protein
MRKTLLVACAAIAMLSAPAFGQAHGNAGGAGGLGVGAGGGLGGPPAGLPAGPPQSLPPGPPTTIPPSPNANTNASGQVQGDVHAQTDVHASDRAHERTGASVDHSASAATGAGAASRSFRVGQRVSSNEKFYTDLDKIPSTARTQIPGKYQSEAYRYIYQPDAVYVVANSSDKVVSVINLNP